MQELPLKSLRVQRLEIKSAVTGLPMTNKRDGAECVVSLFLLLKAARMLVGEGSAKRSKIFGQF